MEEVTPGEVFKRDLAKGHEHEQVILNLIRETYPLALSTRGYFKEFDIWVPEVDMGIEVKSDEKSQETGNIVVEVEFGGKPSALATTTAQFWVIWDGIEYSWFQVEDIWKCIKEGGFRLATFTGRGDATAKKAYLVKKEVLWEYRSQISII